MSVFGVVKGLKMRVTKVDSCGRPVPGPANYLVTDGFVSAELTPVMREAQDLEQPNAEGRICVADRTPPERKWHTAALELCRVNTGLIAMATSFPQITDYDDNPVGFRDRKRVESDYGLAIEIWTGGAADDDCQVPTDDSIFTQAGSGKKYGYLLFFAKEFQLGNIRVAAEIANFTLTGITMPGTLWGRGPWNVAAIDSDNTAGRLLEPLDNDQHYALFRTPIAPPDATPGAEPAALEISTKFVAPDYYYGGPGNAPAADVAPSQANATAYSVAITGGPTGGSFQLLADGLPATITYNSTNAAAKTALAAIDDGHAASEWTVTGGALPGTPLVVTPPVGVVLDVGTVSLTGGTTPTVTVEPV